MTLLRVMRGNGNLLTVMIFKDAAAFYAEVLLLTRLDPIRLPKGSCKISDIIWS
jgi:hypothetical protein